MKKIVSLVMIVMLTITGLSCYNSPPARADEIEDLDTVWTIPTPLPVETLSAIIQNEFIEDAPVKSHREEFDVPDTIPLQHIEEETSFVNTPNNAEAVLSLSLSATIVFDESPLVDAQCGRIESVPVTQDDFHDNIPLTREEQNLLITACKEFEVPYALALALIEVESTFQNTIGDSGDSFGYMQVQPRWHYDRMERLEVTDLLDPNGNFRVGLDYLSELYGTYGDWNTALTVYNMGSNPGYVNDYAVTIMSGYLYWQNLVEDYV